MKYGQTLKSLPTWSYHNVDYDDIKLYIKKHTTAGAGKPISVPGRAHERFVDLEQDLFAILNEQHERISVFVRSKTGEIQRRLDHARKQSDRLASRHVSTRENKIPIRRLERFGSLENDVLKAGEELRYLAGFIGAQRTAFRKLLKKFKKWTGSSNVETRFQNEVFEHPQSFSKVDLNSMLDEYSAALVSVRTAYENGISQNKAMKKPSDPLSTSSETIAQLQAALKADSRVDFDTAIATVPLGGSATLANYFVHFDNVVELQVLLLQYMEYYTSRSRSNSASPHGSSSLLASDQHAHPPSADYFMRVADSPHRLANDQNTLTVDDREHRQGFIPQRAKASVRWNDGEKATLSVQSGSSTIKTTSLKQKYIHNLFDKSGSFPKKKDVRFDGLPSLEAIRDDLLKHDSARPLYDLASCRSRMMGTANDSRRMILATLDTHVNMQSAKVDGESQASYDFPFAILQVRQEGPDPSQTIVILDHSHLVERVRGFSLQYHALWQTCGAANTPAPFWLPLLSRDIRKLPPAAIRGQPNSSGSQTATQLSASTNSLLGNTSGSTAVETNDQGPRLDPEQLQTPPLRSFRKKRRRIYAERASRQKQRYWSEYDQPDDDVEDGEAFVIYVDPNKISILDQLFDKLGDLLWGRRSEEESFLPAPKVEESSSDEEEAAAQEGVKSYGTVTSRPSSLDRMRSRHPRRLSLYLPQITTMCLLASVAILISAFVLQFTSGHKHATEAGAGIMFATACSLLFAIAGVLPLLRRSDISWLSFGIAAAVLIFDAVCAGALFVGILG